MSGKFWDEGPMVVTGCTKVSPGCKNCWSEKAHAMRMNNPAVEHVYPRECITEGRFNGKVRFNLKALERAVRGNKAKVIAIWNDLYHEDVTLSQVSSAHQFMSNLFAQVHTFLIITKRIERAAQFCKGVNDMTGATLPHNIWHIATAENQEMLDKRLPYLLQIPGQRGLIIEPMLGAVDIGNGYGGGKACSEPNAHLCGYSGCAHECGRYHPFWGKRIHQVICGPENGPGKRPFDIQWAIDLRAQCDKAGIPFFWKGKPGALGEGADKLAWRVK